MQVWEIVLWIAVGYVAVMSLARLMLARHARLLAELRDQAAAERRKRPPGESTKKAA
jgi:hypothetical protein